MSEAKQKTHKKKDPALKSVEQLSKSLHKANQKMRFGGQYFFNSLISQSKITYIDTDKKYAIILVQYLEQLSKKAHNLQHSIQQLKQRELKNDQQLRFLRLELINKEKQMKSLLNFKNTVYENAKQLKKRYNQMKQANSKYADSILSISNCSSTSECLKVKKNEKCPNKQSFALQTQQLTTQINKNIKFITKKVIELHIESQDSQINGKYEIQKFKQQLQNAIKVIIEKSKELSIIIIHIDQLKVIKKQNQQLKNKVKTLQEKYKLIQCAWRNKMSKLLQSVHKQWMNSKDEANYHINIQKLNEGKH